MLDSGYRDYGTPCLSRSYEVILNVNYDTDELLCLLCLSQAESIYCMFLRMTPGVRKLCKFRIGRESVMRIFISVGYSTSGNETGIPIGSGH